MKKNCKYLFIFSHDSQITWYSVFARGYKECGSEYKTAIFVHGKEDVARAEAMNCYDVIYDVIDGFVFNQNKSVGDPAIHETILELENTTLTSFFWEDVKTDRWARKCKNASFVVQYMNHAVANVLNAYNDLNPVIALGEYTMALYRFAYRFFASKQKLMLYPITTRYYNRFYLETNVYWEWDKCRELYNKYIQCGVPEEIKLKVYPYYEQIVLKYSKPNYTCHQNKHPVGYTQLSKITFWDALGRILFALRRVEAEERKRNIRYSLIEYGLMNKLIRMIKQRKNHWKYNNIIARRLPSEIKYAIYFMHYQPEYTTDSLGKYYTDQQSLIKNIASSLPADMYLLVKEHPTMIGLREIDVYRDILSNTNVILIDHTFDSVKLMRESQIVFTIVGTPALEAMFIGKPAIMFGRYAFAQTNLISLCTDIWQLGKMVREKLSVQVSPADVEKHAFALLAAKYEASKPGQIPIAAELIDEFVMNENQYSCVKRSFQAELDQLGILT